MTGARSPCRRRSPGGLPLVLLVAALLAPMPKPYESIANVIALAWMAVACALNARRCGRLHCFITAPVFALAAVLVGLAEFGAIRVGGLGPIVTLTIASALSAGF